MSTLESFDGGKTSNEISTLEKAVNIAGAHEEVNKDEQNGDKGEPKGQLVQEEEREKADVEAPVEGTTLIEVYVGLAIGSSLCILVRALILVTVGYKTATILF
ncbi:ABC transporter C family member 3-like, partial [Trifolium medium]|nr:ABC transporter C family member 3-like [Trifolium medium]